MNLKWYTCIFMLMTACGMQSIDDNSEVISTVIDAGSPVIAPTKPVDVSSVTSCSPACGAWLSCLPKTSVYDIHDLTISPTYLCQACGSAGQPECSFASSISIGCKAGAHPDVQTYLEPGTTCEADVDGGFYISPLNQCGSICAQGEDCTSVLVTDLVVKPAPGGPVPTPTPVLQCAACGGLNEAPCDISGTTSNCGKAPSLYSPLPTHDVPLVAINGACSCPTNLEAVGTSCGCPINTNYNLVSQTCIACGGLGQPVCPGVTCNAANTVNVEGQCSCVQGTVNVDGACVYCGCNLEPACPSTYQGVASPFAGCAQIETTGEIFNYGTNVFSSCERPGEPQSALLPTQDIPGSNPARTSANFSSNGQANIGGYCMSSNAYFQADTTMPVPGAGLSAWWNGTLSFTYPSPSPTYAYAGGASDATKSLGKYTIGGTCIFATNSITAGETFDTSNTWIYWPYSVSFNGNAIQAPGSKTFSTTVSPGTLGSTLTPDQWRSIVTNGTLGCSITSQNLGSQGPVGTVSGNDATNSVVQAECDVCCSLVLGEDMPPYCDEITTSCTCDFPIGDPGPGVPVNCDPSDEDCNPPPPPPSPPDDGDGDDAVHAPATVLTGLPLSASVTRKWSTR